jgi:hypothetical protein
LGNKLVAVVIKSFELCDGGGGIPVKIVMEMARDEAQSLGNWIRTRSMVNRPRIKACKNATVACQQPYQI